jgi:glycerol-3-phosphate acyltransferase PlsY
MIWLSWFLVPATYLLGSVSFAWLAGKLKGIDLRQQGSGNLGATNAARVLGRAWFIPIFTLDLLKGLGPVLLAEHLHQNGASSWLPLATAAAAILGHSFTCFHRFRGGKAAATSLGVLIALVWEVAALTLAVWFVVWGIGIIAFGRRPAMAVGPASVIAAMAAPIIRTVRYPTAWQGGELPITVLILVVAILVLIRHRSNIQGMFQRQDGKPDQPPPPPPPTVDPPPSR